MRNQTVPNPAFLALYTALSVACGVSRESTQAGPSQDASLTDVVSRDTSALADAAAVCAAASDLSLEGAPACARAFLQNTELRREVLEQSLIVRDNDYARLRLAKYAVEGGWDALPVYDPPVARYLSSDSGKLTTNDAELATAFDPSADIAQWTLEDWKRLGERAFFRYPAQPFSALIALGGETASAATLEQLGLWRDINGYFAGLVSVQNSDGSREIALTCASCHAQTAPNAELRVGAPSEIDMTALSSVGHWGASKVDVTADGVSNPVAIADLRATRFERRLHHSGNLSNDLLTLAVRVETLLLTSQGQVVRPPREVVYALAVYIWSLGEDLAQAAAGKQVATVSHPGGAALFAANCARCHDGKWGEGDWVALDALPGAESLVATSTDRGSGGYRVPSLLGFDTRRLSHEALACGAEYWLAGGSCDGLERTLGHWQQVTGLVPGANDLSQTVEFLRAAFSAAE